MKPAPASPRFLAGLGLALALFAVWSAIGCRYPQDWWLENALVLTTVAYLWLTYARAPLSRTNYVLILLFLGLHEVGAHTTFAEVPYDDWSRHLFGVSLNAVLGWERNHYDRLVHLCYGLLITLPMQETIELRLGGLRGFARYFIVWIFILATSSAYELIEWAAALVFGGDLGQAYLGTQGDVWDSHKDTGLAVLGATVVLGAQALGRLYRRPTV
ncbi:MAG: DUF2238 domain-containing protein [Opitutus sp.]|nr:DUF2238 domain-containing protein [Opitutus sp.]